MANDILMTVCGNLTADPEVRYVQSGHAVANFTIASTPRTFDRDKNEWVDGEATFLRCSIWREYAENVAASLTKGMRVIATGRFKTRQYEDREGNKRTSIELEVDEIGPSLRYATAAVQRVQRGGGPGAPSAYQHQQDDAWAGASDSQWAEPQAAQQAAAAQQGPWTTPAATPADSAWKMPGQDADGIPF